MVSRREILLEAIDQWHDEGILTEQQREALRARYAPPPGHVGALEGEALEGDPLDLPLQGAPGERAPFAANALQLVGGLLLGAALVALTFFMEVEGETQAWTLVVLGLAGVAAGVTLHYLAPGRDGMEQALLAMGLVPLAISGFPVMDDAILPGILAAAAAVAVYVVRRGRGPVVVLAGLAYVLATLHVSGPRLFGPDSLSPYVWWLLLLAFGGLLLAFRDEGWTTVGLGLYVLPLTISFVMVASEAWAIHDSTTIQALVGAYLALLLGLGIALGNRGLVTGAAAGLTIDAVVFAADLGGPGTAVVVLVALGGLLVWQAEFLRAYFRRPRRPASGKR